MSKAAASEGKRPITRVRWHGEDLDKGAVDLATVRLAQAKDEVEIGAIEEGIPVPKLLGRVPSAIYTAVCELQPGQSRLFKADAKSLYGHAKRAKLKGFGSLYAIRAVEQGARVWRIE
jgi:hypothetical protein